MSEDDQDVVALAAHIVSAFVANNSVPQTDLAALIASTHAALAGLGQSQAPAPEEKAVPAVSIKKSITPDYLICLEDGKKYKSLKRHLRTSYDMTPEEYRAKWGLPIDYPMVAPAYAEARSQLAKKMGLGQQRRKAPPARPRAKAKA
ncbi:MULTISPECIES: MucR family transcriptional regulator [unclassified Bosea (in: a-proteobacteria)]|uniref:MucR family transcriptional regulator n=1 Tax=unclassified Bosea (in: a-proteobacteria) TaxID=2653178 RepID=UPI000F752E53|nr:MULTISPECIES: MucR family transcriptional regulator [unclassified Bosea (in: a-proteobacteria)]AZO81820.1 MucR family transcriptional regulator [Bosea sp. Tri-49]RXT24908.1 MucR family transcriptional regulator [Bosea sp. Tri-39]RXT33460.1 MucR family transcriptional regulator [Bosea sp. Tri-54]